MDTIQKIDYKDYVIKVYYDECADWDNDGDHLGIFYSSWRDINPDGHSIDEIIDDKGHIKSDYVYVVVYAYMHGGITIHADTNPWYDPWDSGYAGVYAVSKEKILEEYGKINTKTIEMAKKCLRSEIETLDCYYRGEVYGYKIEDPDGNEYDSCWGYVGDWEDMVEECKSMIDAAIERWFKIHGRQLEIEFPPYEDELVKA